ncbi:hypothetical protein BC937DRAFT_89150, partial [Endogone sp. FLAS-F59071]
METDEAPIEADKGKIEIVSLGVRITSGLNDETSMTFSLKDEDHTLGNALRPEVDYCGYSIPHPSEAKMNIRIQTT